MILGRLSQKLENETTEFTLSKNPKFPFFANCFYWKWIKTWFTFRFQNEQTQKSVFDCFRINLESFRYFKIEVHGDEIWKLERILQGVEKRHDTCYGSRNDLCGAVNFGRRSIEMKCGVTDQALSWDWRQYGRWGFDY